MFLNEPVFKKICAIAYKGPGLLVERTAEGVIVIRPKSMNSWKIEAMEEFLTNKAKAILVELIGDFPELGETYEYRKQVAPQKYLDGMQYTDLKMKYDHLRKEFETTRILVDLGDDLAAMLQDKVTKEKVLIHNTLMNLIDVSNVDSENGEILPLAPRTDITNSIIIWKNNVMAIQGQVIKQWSQGENELITLLGSADMNNTFDIKKEDEDE